MAFIRSEMKMRLLYKHHFYVKHTQLYILKFRRYTRRCIYMLYMMIKKGEPIKDRYISKSLYGSNMIDISFESELLKFLDSVPLFIVRYKQRPRQVLTYHPKIDHVK